MTPRVYTRERFRRACRLAGRREDAAVVCDLRATLRAGNPVAWEARRRIAHALARPGYALSPYAIY